MEIRRSPGTLAGPCLAQGPVHVSHRRYEAWRERRGHRPPAPGYAFGDQLTDRHFEPVRNVPVTDDLLAAVHVAEHETGLVGSARAVSQHQARIGGDHVFHLAVAVTQPHLVCMPGHHLVDPDRGVAHLLEQLITETSQTLSFWSAEEPVDVV